MTSRAVSSGTIDSLALVLSTSIVLPNGVVNLCGTIPHAYFINVSIDLSLSSLVWAKPGAAAPASKAAAHANATPALAPLPIFPSLLLPSPCSASQCLSRRQPHPAPAGASLDG